MNAIREYHSVCVTRAERKLPATLPHASTKRKRKIEREGKKKKIVRYVVLPILKPTLYKLESRSINCARSDVFPPPPFFYFSFFFLFNSSSRRNSKLEPNINPNRSFPFEPSPFRPFISSPFTSWELALESVRVANLNLGRSSNVQITGYRYRFSTFRCKHTDGHHSSHETTVADGNSSTLALHPVTPFPGIFFRFSVTLQRLIFPFHSGPRLLRENRSTLALPPYFPFYFSLLFPFSSPLASPLAGLKLW